MAWATYIPRTVLNDSSPSVRWAFPSRPTAGVALPSLPAPTAPRFEHLPADRAALGIGTGTPRLSWQLAEAPDGYRQAAYEVAVRRPGAAEEVARVESADQVLVPWPIVGRSPGDN